MNNILTVKEFTLYLKSLGYSSAPIRFMGTKTDVLLWSPPKDTSLPRFSTGPVMYARDDDVSRLSLACGEDIFTIKAKARLLSLSDIVRKAFYFNLPTDTKYVLEEIIYDLINEAADPMKVIDWIVVSNDCDPEKFIDNFVDSVINEGAESPNLDITEIDKGHAKDYLMQMLLRYMHNRDYDKEKQILESNLDTPLGKYYLHVVNHTVDSLLLECYPRSTE